jgi:hypothetical protein
MLTSVSNDKKTPIEKNTKDYEVFTFNPDVEHTAPTDDDTFMQLNNAFWKAELSKPVSASPVTMHTTSLSDRARAAVSTSQLDTSVSTRSRVPICLWPIPAVSVVETPVVSVVETPVVAVVETPAVSVVETPVVAVVETPVVAVLDTPVVAVLDTPVVAVIDTPVVEVVETPVVAVLDTPVVAVIDTPVVEVVDMPVVATPSNVETVIMANRTAARKYTRRTPTKQVKLL